MITDQEILSLPILGDGFEGSIGEMFVELACRVWDKEESFSGKRPWGNGAWKYPVYATLIKAGVIAGEVGEQGFIRQMGADYETVDLMLVRLFRKAVSGLFTPLQ